jgi:hypothetical protein
MFGPARSIIGPDPCPEPPLEADGKILLGLALLYLAFLILARGIAVEKALSMASSRYHISKAVLRKFSKGRLWK